ncbi:MAG: bifunctional methylenetetrahydrofolate dehydrogenase/methenyltetrahydrofolate cyclohydrolase FolD [Solirubrobacteraceae bacterium]
MALTKLQRVPERAGSERGALLDGRAIATQLRESVAARVTERAVCGRRAPALATVLVGEDPGSQAYIDAKHRACTQAGILSIDHRLRADVNREEVAELIRSLNADAGVDGILLQLPLPASLDAMALVDVIDPGKDVDGLTKSNAGALWRGEETLAPCTPLGIVELLARSRLDLPGRDALIVGRSNLVAKPLAAMLLARDMTVTISHSRTRSLQSTCRRADVLISACGVPRLIGAGHVRPGAVVIDVGITRTEDGLVGDVDFTAVRPLASAITPVPGGVGPMTIACLLANTMRAAELCCDGEPTRGLDSASSPGAPPRGGGAG